MTEWTWIVVLILLVAFFIWRRRKPVTQKKPGTTISGQIVAPPTEKKNLTLENIKIVAEYGAFLEREKRGAYAIKDVNLLPYSKEQILDAIGSEIVRETDETKIEVMAAAAIFLSEYQEGVGPRPLFDLGFDLTDVDLSKVDTVSLAKKIANNPDREAFEKFSALSQSDMQLIQSKIDAAKLISKQMPYTKKKEIFGI